MSVADLLVKVEAAIANLETIRLALVEALRKEQR